MLSILTISALSLFHFRAFNEILYFFFRVSFVLSFSCFALEAMFDVAFSPKPKEPRLLSVYMCWWGFHGNFHPLQKNRKEKRQQHHIYSIFMIVYEPSCMSRLFVLSMISWVKLLDISCLCSCFLLFPISHSTQMWKVVHWCISQGWVVGWLQLRSIIYIIHLIKRGKECKWNILYQQNISDDSSLNIHFVRVAGVVDVKVGFKFKRWWDSK